MDTFQINGSRLSHRWVRLVVHGRHPAGHHLLRHEGVQPVRHLDNLTLGGKSRQERSLYRLCLNRPLYLSYAASPITEVLGRNPGQDTTFCDTTVLYVSVFGLYSTTLHHFRDAYYITKPHGSLRTATSAILCEPSVHLPCELGFAGSQDHNTNQPKEYSICRATCPTGLHENLQGMSCSSKWRGDIRLLGQWTTH